MTIRTSIAPLAVALLAACGGSPPKSGAASAAPSTPGTPPVTSDPGAAGTPPVVDPASTTATTETTAPAADAPGPGGDLASGLAHVRVLGVSNTRLTALLVAVRALEVTVDGAPATVDLSRVSPSFDLANGAQAWLAGRFPMPPAGATVHVKLTLDDPATFTDAAGSGDVRACGPPIEFSAPAAWFALRGHAVVHLDLDRSVQGGGASRTLVPQLQVRF